MQPTNYPFVQAFLLMLIIPFLLLIAGLLWQKIRKKTE